MPAGPPVPLDDALDAAYPDLASALLRRCRDKAPAVRRHVLGLVPRLVRGDERGVAVVRERRGGGGVTEGGRGAGGGGEWWRLQSRGLLRLGPPRPMLRRHVERGRSHTPKSSMQ